MKSTAAKKIFLPILLIFFVLVTLLAFVNRHYVNRVVMEENKDTLRSVAMSMDAMWESYIVPMSGCTQEEFEEAFIDIAQDYIYAYQLDYVCLVLPSEAMGGLFYPISVCGPNTVLSEKIDECTVLRDMPFPYTPTKDDLALWSGDKPISFLLFNGSTGDTLCAVIREQAPDGSYIGVSMEKSQKYIIHIVRRIWFIQTIVVFILFRRLRIVPSFCTVLKRKGIGLSAVYADEFPVFFLNICSAAVLTLQL